jgi:dTDP-4-dehydrorhamnose 3,5-epimerase
LNSALRGIKYSRAAKYVTCLAGVVLDVVVDLRVGSPTFGASHGERLDGSHPVGLFLGPGLGHATLALTEDAAVAYLLPAGVGEPEGAVHPFDADLGIAWPSVPSFLLSAGDIAAPTLAQARDDGLLPVYREGES